MPPQHEINELRRLILSFYRSNGRHALPWRVAGPNRCFDPYYIWLSEVMLQQTQVPRVLSKYKLFLGRYPTVRTLADADFSEVLGDWMGLGYNRRAKYLHQAAKAIVSRHGGTLPVTQAGLAELPGIGINTAGAICAYAYDLPALFIETNVRTVLIHHFFSGKQSVDDKQLLPIVKRMLSGTSPREFYWAMMDYGTHLKRFSSAARQSAEYKKQKPYHGSVRQLRATVLRLLLSGPRHLTELEELTADGRLFSVLSTLSAERLIVHKNGTYKLAD